MKSSHDIKLWIKINEEKQLSIEKKREELLKNIIPSIKKYFKKKMVSRAYLVGSVLQPLHFGDNSDIDIAVENLNEDYFRTMCELEELLQRNVDLIEIEKCSFAKNIRERGLLIYEK